MLPAPSDADTAPQSHYSACRRRSARFRAQSGTNFPWPVRPRIGLKHIDRMASHLAASLSVPAKSRRPEPFPRRHASPDDGREASRTWRHERSRKLRQPGTSGNIPRRRQLAPVGLADQDHPAGTQAARCPARWKAATPPPIHACANTGGHRHLVGSDAARSIAAECLRSRPQFWQHRDIACSRTNDAHIDAGAGGRVIGAPGAQHLPELLPRI